MIFNAKDKSWGFYTDFLDRGEFIQVGIKGIIDQWTIYFTLSMKDVVNDNS